MAVNKVCSETPSSQILYNTQRGQLIGFYIIPVFTERYFRTDYTVGFFQRYAYLKTKQNKTILIPWKYHITF